MSITEIPSFNDYLIDTAGEVYFRSSGEKITSFVKNGRNCVNLYRVENGSRLRKTAYVCRLMAEAYLDEYRNDLCVVHIDGDTLNDSLDNLKCVSKSESLKRRVCNSHPLVMNEGTGEVFSTYADAARSVNGHRNGVYLCAIGIQAHHKGHKFKYVR